MRAWLPMLVVGLLIGALTTFVALRRTRMLRTAPPESAVVVNGLPVSMDEFESELKVRHGGEVLADLVQQKLIFEKARKDNCKLTAEEELELALALGSLRDPATKGVLESTQRSQILLRKLILQPIKEKEKLRIYNLYREELVRYEVFVIVLATESDARLVWKNLGEGILTFDQLVKTYSLDPTNGGKLGILSLQAIRERLGEEAAQVIAAMKPNTACPPMYCSQGMMVIRLGAVLRSYQELKPTIENILIESQKAQFARDLIGKAKIQSNFLDLSGHARVEEARAITHDTVGLPKPTPESLVKPEVSGTPATNNTLPQVHVTPTSTLPPGIPKPKTDTPALNVTLPKPTDGQPLPGLPRPQDLLRDKAPSASASPRL